MGFFCRNVSLMHWMYLIVNILFIFLLCHRKYLFDKTIPVSGAYSVLTILQNNNNKKQNILRSEKKDPKHQRMCIDILKREILYFFYKNDSHFEILCLTQNKNFKNKI